MGLICKIRGHAWNKLPDGSDGCTCTRCGEHRDEGHDWDGCTCKRCGAHRGEGHDWDGCTCKRCGASRNQGHIWAGDRCERCGRTREQTCRAFREKGRHAFKQQKGCRRRCTECGYTMVWHEFRNGTCTTCGVDESDYYAKLIMSGKVKYENKDDSGNSRNRPTYGDHVKTVAALRAIAMSEKGKPSYNACLDCARKLRDIAKAGGTDAHDANVALRDIVMEPVLFWDTLEIARWITEPELASDPALIKHVREVRDMIAEYDNAMIASDSGLYTTG